MIRAAAALALVAACGSAPAASHPTSAEALPENRVEPSTDKPAVPDAVEHFYVMFAQGDDWYDTADNQVSLAREPFAIVIFLAEPGGLLINVSEQPSSLEAAADGRPLADIPGFHETGMAEWLFNKQHAVFVEDRAPSFWYFATADDHRFDEPCEVRENYLMCKRTVEKLMYRDGPTVAVEKAPDRLYFTFVQTQRDGSQQTELARSWVTVELQ